MSKKLTELRSISRRSSLSSVFIRTIIGHLLRCYQCTGSKSIQVQVVETLHSNILQTRSPLAQLVDLLLEVLVGILSLLEWKSLQEVRRYLNPKMFLHETPSSVMSTASRCVARLVPYGLILFNRTSRPRPFLPEKLLDCARTACWNTSF